MKNNKLTLIAGALRNLIIPPAAEGAQYKENQLVASRTHLSLRVGNTWAPVASLNDMLYNFNEVTFTNLSRIGRTAATPAEFLAAYSAAYPWTADSDNFSSISGVQLWTVPVNGRYQFRVTGAGHGSHAEVAAILELKRGDKLRIIVGQNGDNGQAGCGASSVALENTALIVAGGGAGYRGPGLPSSIANLSAPGTGVAGTTAWNGRFADSGASGQGGASFTTNGSVGSGGQGGQSPTSHRSTALGGIGNRPTNGAGTVYNGGFGGGGGVSRTTENGGVGGGGGYTGGAGLARELSVTPLRGISGTSYAAPSAENATGVIIARPPAVLIQLLP